MTERLRVAHVMSVMDYGGVEAMALLLLKQLPASEFEHHLFYIGMRPPHRLMEFAASASSLTQLPYRLRRWFSFNRQLSRKLRDQHIDVLLCHNFGHHPWIGMAAWRAGVKRVYTIVASSPCITPLAKWKNRFKGWLGRYWTNLEIAVSSPVAQELETETGIPSSRIRIIVNCCLTQEIGERADRVRKQHSGLVPQLIMVARMDEAKDQDTLLEAIAVLKQQGRRIQLCLAGDGPRKAHLHRLTQELGLEDRVLFHGARHDIPELLGASDLFIFATKTEGFPLALIEAMSAGTPIISSDLPVCREILEQGTCGVLYPVGDAPRLAEAIAHLIDHPEEARQLAEHARARANAQYNPAFTVQQYARLLRGELDHSSKSSQ